MNSAISQLSNREIALLIWLVLLLVAAVAYRPTRQSLGPILKLVFLSKVGIALLAMLAYVSFAALVFHWFGLSHWWMLKDALFWFFGTAVILLFNANEESKEKHFIRKAAVDNLKFAVVLDFVLNLYVFNLAVELVLLPFLVMLATLAVVAATKDEYKPARKLIDRVTAIIGFGFLIYALVNIIGNPRCFATVQNLEDYSTPIALSLVLLPFVYAAALCMAYEELFVRVGLRIQDKQLSTYAKRQIIGACRLKVRNVNRFAKDFVHLLGGAASREEILHVIDAFVASADDEGNSESKLAW